MASPNKKFTVYNKNIDIFGQNINLLSNKMLFILIESGFWLKIQV